MKLFTILLLIFTGTLFSQTATSPLGNYVSTTLPSTCNVGSMFFNTTSSPGANVWLCTSTNVWTQQIGGGSAISGTNGQVLTSNGLGAFGTPVTLPSFPIGTIVGTTDTQTLSNKIVDGVTPSVMAFLDATSSIQSQINAKQPLINVAAQTGKVIDAIVSGVPNQRALVSGDIPNNAANTTGNASTATALAGTPTLCSSGQSPTGVLANGNATGCQAVGGSGGLTSIAPSTGGGMIVANGTGPNATVGVDSAIIPYLANSQIFAAGAKQTFSPNTTTAGLRIVSGTQPNTPVGGDLNILTSDGSFNIYNSVVSAWQKAACASTTLTANMPIIGNGTFCLTTGAVTGTGTQFVMSNAPTISLPFISDLTNANHNHTNAAGGGQLGLGALTATGTPSSTTFLRGDNTWATAGGTGTVTSVQVALPATFSVTGGPITGSGTITGTYVSQTQNLIFASPNGSSGTPTFRALVAADVPTLNQNTTGTAASSATITASCATPTFTAGGTTTVNWTGVDCAIVTASGGNTTLAFSNPHGSGPYSLILINDTTARTWTIPANFKQALAPAVASAATFQTITYDGANYQGHGSSEAPSVIRLSTERSAPAAAPTADGRIYADSTDHDLEFINASGSTYKMFLTGVDTNPVTGTLKFGPGPSQTSVTDIWSNGTTGGNPGSTTENGFATSFTISGASTASTIDGIHKTMAVSWGGDVFGNNSATNVTRRVRACPVANWSAGVCSAGSSLLWTSATAPYGGTTLLQNTDMFYITATAAAGTFMVTMPLRPVAFSQAPATSQAMLSTNCTACTGGSWVLYYTVQYAASATGTAVCAGVTTGGTVCSSVEQAIAEFKY
jgi:hypothetical protein